MTHCIRRLILCFFILHLSAASLWAYSTSSQEFVSFLNTLGKKCAEYGWTDVNLDKIPWEYHRRTQQGRPLMFTYFGDTRKNCTLVQAGVHGDEIPTVYVLLKLAEAIADHPSWIKDKCIVIAPLINPDGFFADPPQRVNASGVDSNRNFPTRDWNKNALRFWENRKRKNKRYFPGKQSNSEQETRFQVALIYRFKPEKIVSLHSPLGFYDYDGPSASLDSFGKWIADISQETDYPFKKFGIYPGSLGNYAGYERHILTLTLELPSSDPAKGPQYFDKFKPAILKFTELSAKSML